MWEWLRRVLKDLKLQDLTSKGTWTNLINYAHTFCLWLKCLCHEAVEQWLNHHENIDIDIHNVLFIYPLLRPYVSVYGVYIYQFCFIVVATPLFLTFVQVFLLKLRLKGHLISQGKALNFFTNKKCNYENWVIDGLFFKASVFKVAVLLPFWSNPRTCAQGPVRLDSHDDSLYWLQMTLFQPERKFLWRSWL